MSPILVIEVVEDGFGMGRLARRGGEMCIGMRRVSGQVVSAQLDLDAHDPGCHAVTRQHSAYT